MENWYKISQQEEKTLYHAGYVIPTYYLEWDSEDKEDRWLGVPENNTPRKVYYKDEGYSAVNQPLWNMQLKLFEAKTLEEATEQAKNDPDGEYLVNVSDNERDCYIETSYRAYVYAYNHNRKYGFKSEWTDGPLKSISEYVSSTPYFNSKNTTVETKKVHYYVGMLLGDTYSITEINTFPGMLMQKLTELGKQYVFIVDEDLGNLEYRLSRFIEIIPLGCESAYLYAIDPATKEARAKRSELIDRGADIGNFIHISNSSGEMKRFNCYSLPGLFAYGKYKDFCKSRPEYQPKRPPEQPIKMYVGEFSRTKYNITELEILPSESLSVLDEFKRRNSPFMVDEDLDKLKKRLSDFIQAIPVGCNIRSYYLKYSQAKEQLKNAKRNVDKKLMPRSWLKKYEDANNEAYRLFAEKQEEFRSMTRDVGSVFFADTRYYEGFREMKLYTIFTSGPYHLFCN